MIQFDEHIFFKMGGSTSILDTFFYGMIRNDQIETTHCNLSSRQFIATKPPVGQKVVKSKGILPKMALIQVKDLYIYIYKIAQICGCLGFQASLNSAKDTDTTG